VIVTRKVTEGEAIAPSRAQRFVVVPYQAGTGRQKRDAKPQFGVVAAVYGLQRVGSREPYALVRRLGSDGFVASGEDSWTCQRVRSCPLSLSNVSGCSPIMLGWVNSQKLCEQLDVLRDTGKDAEAVASWHANDLQEARQDASRAITPAATGRPKRGRPAATEQTELSSKKNKEDDDVVEIAPPKERSPRKICACSCKCKNKCKGNCKKNKNKSKCKGKCVCKCKCSGTCTCDGKCKCVWSHPPKKNKKEDKEKKGQGKKEVANEEGKGRKEREKYWAQEHASEQALKITPLEEKLAQAERRKADPPSVEDQLGAADKIISAVQASENRKRRQIRQQEGEEAEHQQNLATLRKAT
jgi:hypothetical protein